MIFYDYEALWVGEPCSTQQAPLDPRIPSAICGPWAPAAATAPPRAQPSAARPALWKSRSWEDDWQIPMISMISWEDEWENWCSCFIFCRCSMENPDFPQSFVDLIWSLCGRWMVLECLTWGTQRLLVASLKANNLNWRHLGLPDHWPNFIIEWDQNGLIQGIYIPEFLSWSTRIPSSCSHHQILGIKGLLSLPPPFLLLLGGPLRSIHQLSSVK